MAEKIVFPICVSKKWLVNYLGVSHTTLSRWLENIKGLNDTKWKKRFKPDETQIIYTHLCLSPDTSINSNP